MRTNHSDSLTIKITPNATGNPPGKLADAELHFGSNSPGADAQRHQHGHAHFVACRA